MRQLVISLLQLGSKEMNACGPVYSDVDPSPWDIIPIQDRSCPLSSFSLEMTSRTHIQR